MKEKMMELYEAAKRAAMAAVWREGGVEEAQCLDALDQLKNCSITYQLLVSTQVVRHLTHMLRHPCRKIQLFTRDLIWSWNDLYLGVDYDNNVIVVTKKAKVVKNVKVEEVINEYQGNVPNASNSLKCNDCIREIVREKLYGALSKVSEEAGHDNKEIIDQVRACDPIQVAISVESAIYENWGRSTGTYKFKYRCLLFNINDPTNREFRKKVLLGRVKPEKIVNMTAKEMASDKMQLWYENLEKERAGTNGRIFSGIVSPKKIISGICKCGRCGHTRMSFISLRRHIACLNCNQYWDSTNPGIEVLPI
ncbi:transcription elongation factor TFIIS [Citrus clementina]|uniref:transcription elongation factor TFIIS n=1 Tax=Citrus clementina TaxID=85681 RepID=UPI000CECEDD8|nr:transcription elongation factor TFIIS [Citrus x clementina]